MSQKNQNFVLALTLSAVLIFGIYAFTGTSSIIVAGLIGFASGFVIDLINPEDKQDERK